MQQNKSFDLQKNGQESIILLPSRLRKFKWPYFQHVPSKNQVVLLGISIFEKSEKTMESNRSADSIRKKRQLSYLLFATWTSNFILYSYNALDVSSPKMELIW